MSDFIKVYSKAQGNFSVEKKSDKEYKVKASWKKNEEKQSMIIELSFPCIDMEFAWQPTCLMNRNLNMTFYSMLTASAPVLAYCNNKGNSVFALALSETKKRVDFSFNIVEETAYIKGVIEIGLNQFISDTEYELYLYIDNSEKQLCEACAEIVKWWDKDNKKEEYIPENAKLPMYSTWYSFHQYLTAEEIEKECVLAKELGMETVIVDDGWQTDDVERGYAYCGDWEVCKSKFPDMKKHIQNIHNLGMKYILWYSVPFLGISSKNWDRFKDKTLTFYEELKAGVLDPRYPDVREFLINTYKNALVNWDLDGFKLDFIDNFSFAEKTEISDRMDYSCIQEAADILMKSIRKELTKIKPDIMLEFRQGYIGPNMRNYGNMFRVVDCPNNYRFNRVGMVDLKMLSGNIAIHSDMLMWNENEKVENAALQILNVLFSVIQFSMRIEKLPQEHLKMVKFWLDFVLKNKELLQNGKFRAFEPQNFYPVIMSENDNEAIICVYQPNKVIKVHNTKKTTIINANKSEKVVVDMDYCGELLVCVYDCMGNFIREEKLKAINSLIKINVPMSGFCIIDFI